MTLNITMIGAGSMAEALIGGWVKDSKVSPDSIMVTNYSNDFKLQELKKKYGISISRSVDKLSEHADVVFLACKPKDWEKALDPFRFTMKQGTPLVSVMAGVTIQSMENFFGDHAIPVIRSIPNTSAIVQASMTPYSIGKWISLENKKAVTHLLQFVGQIAEVPEEKIDAMTALTGTGPAYIYYLMESMEKAAEKIGIDPELARHLVSQTLLGASIRVQENVFSPKSLYEQIMSPGGTTEAGFNVLKERGVQDAMVECIEKAYERSQELGNK
ncbi:pyrroline-5-carboxylate reductase [Salipaludibacillus sp. CF4.18]|uniref:pyrroline-5-carboxylate reductase n=1 Tax=Salipaludibacillus sp. CF4.18 TaxID=3373081 RepID=UPI003EE4A8F7